MTAIYMSMSNRENPGVRVSWLSGGAKVHVVNTVKELVAAITAICEELGIDPSDEMENGFRFSSSMNHPEEYTDDPALLKFTDEIMGG